MEHITRPLSPKNNQFWVLTDEEIEIEISFMNSLMIQCTADEAKKSELIGTRGDIIGITNNDLISIGYYTTNNVIDVMAIIFKHLRDNILGHITILDSSFYSHMTEPYETGFDYDRVKRWTRAEITNLTTGEHLDYPIVTIMHQPGHWFFICILPAQHRCFDCEEPSLHIFDGLQGHQNTNVVNNWQRWYNLEHTDKDRGNQYKQLKVYLHQDFQNHDLTKRDVEQNDRPLSGCGVSAIFHLYYMVVEGRFGYWNDFSFDHLHMMRLYLTKTLKASLTHENTGGQRNGNEIVELDNDDIDEDLMNGKAMSLRFHKEQLEEEIEINNRFLQLGIQNSLLA